MSLNVKLAYPAFAEYTPLQITERGPHPLPENISFEEGATLEPLATSLHSIGLAKPTAGETVVILGAGIIGLGCLQAIRAAGCCRVIVVDASARRLAMARQLGAETLFRVRRRQVGTPRNTDQFGS